MFRSYRDTFRTPVKASKEKTKKYFCDLCDDEEISMGWDLELDVEIHRRRAHKEKLIQMMREPLNFMCSVCLRQQRDRPSLISHIKQHHLLTAPNSTCVKRELFICDYCNNIFFNKLLLIAHINYFHLLTLYQKRTAKTACPSCFKPVKVRSIWFHFLYHGIPHTGTCPICLNTFEDYTETLKHIDSHIGYYSCTICPYAAKKEHMFTNHLQRHKKFVNLEGKDVDSVARFFVPQRRVASWSSKYINIFKGITLAPEVQICVLCRAICESDEQMLQHIHGDHSPVNTVKIKRHMCECGEEFFNGVLLKHHIFTLKGNHKVSDGTSTPSPKRRRIEPTLTEVIIDNERAFGIQVEIEETFSFSNDESCIEPDEEMLYVPLSDESDIIGQLDDSILRQDNDISEEDDKQDVYVGMQPTETEILVSPIVIEDCNESREILSSEEQQAIYIIEDTVPETQEVSNTNSESNKISKQVISDRRDTDEQMLYLTAEQSSEVDQGSDTIRKTNETIESTTSNPTHDQPVMYVTINHGPEVTDHSDNTQEISKTNDTITQTEQNSTVNNIHIDNQMNLVQNRMVISADDVVDNRNHNNMVYQLCDNRSITITRVPKTVDTAKRYYEEVLASQDNVVEVSGSSLATEVGSVAEPQEPVIYQVLQVPAMLPAFWTEQADSSEDPPRLVVEESIMFS